MRRRRSLVACIAAALFVSQVSGRGRRDGTPGRSDRRQSTRRPDRQAAGQGPGRRPSRHDRRRIQGQGRSPRGEQGQGSCQARPGRARCPDGDCGDIAAQREGRRRRDQGRPSDDLLADQRHGRHRRPGGPRQARLEASPAIPGRQGHPRREHLSARSQPIDPKVAVLAAAGDPEWGVAKIRADEAWEKGILGQGVVVANVDTGVDYTHPALVGNYRGNNHDGTFTHDYNWWDPAGVCDDPAPCDNVGHGTHTMGTIVGGDGPGLVHARHRRRPRRHVVRGQGLRGPRLLRVVAAVRGPVHPGPDRPRRREPDGRTSARTSSTTRGAAAPSDTFYQATVLAWRAAGIIPVFSSGNPGPGCGEGGSPGDYLETFSVGATDDEDNIADFSGRGPSFFGKINPDVSAPGVDVVSSVPGGGYEAFSGTSMATPHTAGTIALVLSADQALLGDIGNFGPVTDAIRATAVDRIDLTCGGDDDGDPNNTYGDGRIDAFAATNLVATGGTLSGTVTEAGVRHGGRRRQGHRRRRHPDLLDHDRCLRRLLDPARGRVIRRQRDRVRLLHGQRDRRRDRDRPDHRSGLLARPAAPLHRVRHDHLGRERHRRSRTSPSAPSARPVAPVTSNASGDYRLVLPIGDVHARGLGRRLHRDRQRRDRLGRRRRRPGLRAVPQARRLRPRLRADPVRLGRRRGPDGAVRRRRRRPAAAAVLVRRSTASRTTPSSCPPTATSTSSNPSRTSSRRPSRRHRRRTPRSTRSGATS